MRSNRLKNNKLIVLIIVIGILIIGCSGCNENKPVIEKTNIEGKKVIELDELSNIVFEVNKDTKKASDFDDLELVRAAIAISEKYVDTITGTEIKEIIKKYFDIDNINLVDIICNLPMSEEHDNRMYIYNPKTDKYDSNPDHIAHGGGNGSISYYIINGKKTTEGDYYVFSGKIFYVDNGCIWDICASTGIYNVYLSYEDASNKENKQFNAYEKDGLCIKNTCDKNKIYEEIKDKVKTVSFYYKKNNDNYVFDYYEVK